MTDTKWGLGFVGTLATAGRVVRKMLLNRGDIGEVLRQVTHESGGVVWFKPLNTAIIGHPDMRKILSSSKHHKGDVHAAITDDMGPILVSLSPGHPREEIRAALQRYLDAAHVMNYASVMHQIIHEHTTQSGQLQLQLSSFCDTLTLEMMYRSLFANFVMNEEEREIFADAIAVTILTSFVRATAGKPIARLASMLNGAKSKQDALWRRLQQLWDHYVTLPPEELEKDAFGQLVLAAQSGKITEREAQTQAIMIISAGHETTSSALAWLLYQLAQSPDDQYQLRQEILNNTDADTVDTSVLRSLPLLNLAIDEILRLYAPVWIITRQLGQDEAINQKVLPRDTNVWLITTAAHRWAEIFDNADAFLLNRPKSDYREHTIPFGAGYGSCVGAPFARTEMQIVMAALLRKYSIKLSDDTPTDIRPRYSTAIRIADSAYIVLEPLV